MNKCIITIGIVCMLLVSGVSAIEKFNVTKQEVRTVLIENLLAYYSDPAYYDNLDITTKNELKDLLHTYLTEPAYPVPAYEPHLMYGASTMNAGGTESSDTFADIFTNAVNRLTGALDCPGGIKLGECNDKGKYCFAGKLRTEAMCQDMMTCVDRAGTLCNSNQRCRGTIVNSREQDTCCIGTCVNLVHCTTIQDAEECPSPRLCYGEFAFNSIESRCCIGTCEQCTSEASCVGVETRYCTEPNGCLHNKTCKSDKPGDYRTVITPCVGGCTEEADGPFCSQCVETKGGFEDCDGIDNDCDRQIDEEQYPADNALTGTPCETNLKKCDNYQWVPVDDATDPYYQPVADTTCDGVDNDCNGVVDDSFDLTSDVNNCGACDNVCGLPGVDVHTCNNRVCEVVTCCDSANPGANCNFQVEETGAYYNINGDNTDGCEYYCEYHGNEEVNGTDDNCNGQVDEGLGLVSADDSDGDGIFTIVCETGKYDINDNFRDGCEYGCTPSGAETVNGQDDNCDGNIDEGYHIATTTTSTDASGQIVVTIDSCEPGYHDNNSLLDDGCEYACSATTPPDEVVDNLDNDCNGATDDGLGIIQASFDQLGIVRDIVCVENYYNNNTLLSDGCEYQCEPEGSDDPLDGVDNDCNGIFDDGFGVTHVLLDANGVPQSVTCQENYYNMNQNADDGCEYNCVIDGPEVCDDGIDNDCDNHTDLKDASCVQLTGMKAPDSTVQYGIFKANCTATANVDCVGARIGNDTCSYDQTFDLENGYTFMFICATDDAGSSQFACNLTNKVSGECTVPTTYGNPTDAGIPNEAETTEPVNVIYTNCVSRTTQADCESDEVESTCVWCPKCNNGDPQADPTKPPVYSINSILLQGNSEGYCAISESSCRGSYNCHENECGAQCTTGTSDDGCDTPYDSCITDADGNTVTYRDYTSAFCNPGSCTCQGVYTDNVACPVYTCTASHAHGECQGQCQANTDADDTCIECIPTCECDSSYFDANNDLNKGVSDGCESYATDSIRKDQTTYSNYNPNPDNTVFVVSDRNWHALLTLLPTITWSTEAYDDATCASFTQDAPDWCWCNRVMLVEGTNYGICGYPLIVYNEDTSDLTSIMDTAGQTYPQVKHYTGQFDADGNNDVDINEILGLWSISEVIVVDSTGPDGYELSLLAAQFAMLRNAPLVIDGGPGTIGNSAVLNGKMLLCAGHDPALAPANCYAPPNIGDGNAVITLAELREIVMGYISPDNVIVIEPTDLNTLTQDMIVNTVKDGSDLQYEYLENSFTAPLAATLNHSLIVSDPNSPLISQVLRTDVNDIGIDVTFDTSNFVALDTYNIDIKLIPDADVSQVQFNGIKADVTFSSEAGSEPAIVIDTLEENPAEEFHLKGTFSISSAGSYTYQVCLYYETNRKRCYRDIEHNSAVKQIEVTETS